MLHAAAMLTGLCVLWLLFTQQWSSLADAAMAAGAALASATFAARLGGIGGAFARAPRTLALAISRCGAVLNGAAATMRAALAADITLKPALVRVKTRAGASAKALFADMMSAVPGTFVVETDAEGLLAHVLNEDAIAAADLGELEARVLRAMGRAS